MSELMIREVMSFVCAGALERLGSSLSALLFSEERPCREAVIRRRISGSHASRSEPAIPCMGIGPRGNPPNPSSLAATLPEVAWRAGPTSGRYVQAFQGRNSPVKRLHRDSGQAGRVSPLARDAGRVQTKRTASQLAGALSPSGDSTAGAPSPERYPPFNARRPRSGSPYRGP